MDPGNATNTHDVKILCESCATSHPYLVLLSFLYHPYNASFLKFIGYLYTLNSTVTQNILSYRIYYTAESFLVLL